MTTRTITGTIHYPQSDVPWPNAIVRVVLKTPFATNSATYPGLTIDVPASTSGTFSVTLAVPDTGTALYRFILPDGTKEDVHLAAGPATTLEALILAGAGADVPQNVVQVVVDIEAAARIAADAALQALIGTGGGGGDKTYRHTQSLAATTWMITHNLNKYPTFQVFDSANQAIYGRLTSSSPTAFTLVFSAAVGGRVECN